MEKLCRDCQTLKPTTEFHSDKSKPDGLNFYCKPCMNTRQRAYAKRLPRFTAPEGMKRCTHCKEVLPQEQFHKAKAFHDGLSRRCKKCAYEFHEAWRIKNKPRAAADAKRWRANNKERAADHGRKNLYDLPMGAFEQMLASQDGKCAICERTEAGGRGAFHVDHCHDSGKVRGLLCNSCNGGLGKFRDRPELLLKAVKYLAEGGTEGARALNPHHEGGVGN